MSLYQDRENFVLFCFLLEQVCFGILFDVLMDSESYTFECMSNQSVSETGDSESTGQTFYHIVDKESGSHNKLRLTIYTLNF